LKQPTKEEKTKVEAEVGEKTPKRDQAEVEEPTKKKPKEKEESRLIKKEKKNYHKSILL